MTEPANHNDLELQMRMAKDFMDKVTVIDKPDGQVVEMGFSLNAKVQDTAWREELINAYENTIREVSATLAERLREPLLMASEEARQFYERDLEQAIGDAMTHVQAVLDGTHRWSAYLAPDIIEDEAKEKELSHVDVCRLMLVTKKQPDEDRGQFGFIFMAMLFDQTLVDGKNELHAIDSDPPPESFGRQPGV